MNTSEIISGVPSDTCDEDEHNRNTSSQDQQGAEHGPTQDDLESTESSTLFDSALSHQELGLVSAPAIVDEGPFGYQLSHPSPRRNRFIQKRLLPNLSPTPSRRPCRFSPSPADHMIESTPNKAANVQLNPYAIMIQPSPRLTFLPSSSSTGYTLHGLPIVTLAETLLHSATNAHTAFADLDFENLVQSDAPVYLYKPKWYIPYMQLAYLELTDELISRICPADLIGQPCPHDETFEWNWIEGCWQVCGGGCGMLRLCEVCFSCPSHRSVDTLPQRPLIFLSRHYKQTHHHPHPLFPSQISSQIPASPIAPPPPTTIQV